jgi:hypothetical protein
MLSKRLAGLLKQQYRPEVVFLTGEILLQHAKSAYLSGKRMYGLSAGGLPGLEQLEEDLKEVATTSRDMSRLGWFSGRHWTRSWKTTPDLESFLHRELQEGEWYNQRDLTGHYRTEIMTPWVARQVNRWLKRLDQIEESGMDRGWSEQLVEKHYAELKKMARNVGAISDYLHANCIDAGKFTLNQLLYRSRRWHAALARQQAIESMPPSPVVFSQDGFDVYLLDSSEALKWEGNFMKHCVAGYWHGVQHGVREIYSVREGGMSVATIEVYVPDFARRRWRRETPRVSGPWGQAVQIKGQANRKVNKPPICGVIQDFLLHYGFSNNTDTCALPGASRWGRPDLAVEELDYSSFPGWKEGAPTWRNWDFE